MQKKVTSSPQEIIEILAKNELPADAAIIKRIRYDLAAVEYQRGAKTSQCLKWDLERARYFLLDPEQQKILKRKSIVGVLGMLGVTLFMPWALLRSPSILGVFLLSGFVGFICFKHMINSGDFQHIWPNSHIPTSIRNLDCSDPSQLITLCQKWLNGVAIPNVETTIKKLGEQVGALDNDFSAIQKIKQSAQATHDEKTLLEISQERARLEGRKQMILFTIEQMRALREHLNDQHRKLDELQNKHGVQKEWAQLKTRLRAGDDTVKNIVQDAEKQQSQVQETLTTIGMFHPLLMDTAADENLQLFFAACEERGKLLAQLSLPTNTGKEV